MAEMTDSDSRFLIGLVVDTTAVCDAAVLAMQMAEVQLDTAYKCYWATEGEASNKEAKRVLDDARKLYRKTEVAWHGAEAAYHEAVKAAAEELSVADVVELHKSFTASDKAWQQLLKAADDYCEARVRSYRLNNSFDDQPYIDYNGYLIRIKNDLREMLQEFNLES